MSFELTGNDILDQYRNISNKLKKRFLRKPNESEACECFISLGQQCENLELPAYAGLCWSSAARCEAILANVPGESSCLIRAARQFLKAEENDYNLGCVTPSAENLQAGLNCYAQSCSKLIDNYPIPIGLNLEIVEFLKRIERSEYIESYLQSAVELSEESSDTKVISLGLLASAFVDSGDYTAALEAFVEITSILDKLPINGARSEIFLRCEISCVLLLLILRPAPQKLSHNLAKLLEKYTWGDKNDKSLKACKMSEEMFLLIQSVVTTCQSSDTSSLVHLEGQIWPMLSREEKELLRILVKIYYP